MKKGYVYIITNFNKTVLYVGVTSDLRQRIMDHYEGEGSKFSKKYKCKYLIFYEEFKTITEAIKREKQLKSWRREWKLNLIKSVNTDLMDLSEDFIGK